MTTKWRTEKPASDEHVAYYAVYIAEAPGADVLATLEKQAADVPAFVRGIPESKGDHRYAEGKWSIKDVVLHLCDAERVFSYRLLRFVRNDPTDLPGFDEGVFVKNGGAGARTLAQLADEFAAVRRATLALLSPLQDDAMTRAARPTGIRFRRVPSPGSWRGTQTTTCAWCGSATSSRLSAACRAPAGSGPGQGRPAASP